MHFHSSTYLELPSLFPLAHKILSRSGKCSRSSFGKEFLTENSPPTHLLVVEEVPIEVVLELVSSELLMQNAIERNLPPVKVRAQRGELKCLLQV